MENNQAGNPLVTICSLIYNNADNAIPGLDAIKNQVYTPVEHLIIDDGSTDNSVMKIEAWISYSSYKCKFIVHKKNQGICATLNELISLSRGKYVCWITDDIMFPDKIVKDIEALEKNSSAAFCYSKAIIHYQKTGKEIFQQTQQTDNSFNDFLEGKILLSSPTIMYRKEIFEEVGAYDENLVVEDFDMLLRIMHSHPVVFRDEFSIKYVVHNNNMMQKNPSRLYDEMFRVLKEKWNFLPKYNYYVARRHLNSFYQLAADYKKAAFKHIFPSLRFAFSKTFIAACYRLMLK